MIISLVDVILFPFAYFCTLLETYPEISLKHNTDLECWALNKFIIFLKRHESNFGFKGSNLDGTCSIVNNVVRSFWRYQL